MSKKMIIDKDRGDKRMISTRIGPVHYRAMQRHCVKNEKSIMEVLEQGIELVCSDDRELSNYVQIKQALRRIESGRLNNNNEDK